jgi:hypothetical protein
MERGNLLVIIFLIILIIGLYYLYQNLSSFECSMESSFSNVMSDISYEFEPEGSLYSKTKVFRFNILSSRNRLEYFGMIITRGEEILFFENRTEPEGGSIVATINLNENVTANRFFKKKCYPEVKL